MLNILMNINWDAHRSTYWMLVILGLLVLIEIAVFAILLIRNRLKKAQLADAEIIGIELDPSRTKREYLVGDIFDPSGLVAIAHYNGTSFKETLRVFTILTPALIKKYAQEGVKPEELEGCVIYPPDLSVEGNPVVTVCYRGVSAQYVVSVKRNGDAKNAPEAPVPAPQPMPQSGMPVYVAQQPAQPLVYVIRL